MQPLPHLVTLFSLVAGAGPNCTAFSFSGASDTLVVWIRRRTLLGASVVTAALPRRARSANKPIRIGVLTDMTGAYAANTGPGSVLGAQMAGEDFMSKHSEVKAEVVQADLQLKPDVALAIATDWFDNQGVDLLTDVPLSSAAFERARTWRGGRSLGRPSARQRPVARERRGSMNAMDFGRRMSDKAQVNPEGRRG